MSIRDKIFARLDELIEIGDEMSKLQSKEQIDISIYDRWTLNYENLLRLIFIGRFDDIMKEIERKRHGLYRLGIAQYVTSLLKATKDDLERGLIGNLEHEIRKVEIKSLLDYSFELLEEKDDALDRCACILARIVLEKTLQLLCDKNNLDSTKKANMLNQDLWKKGIYVQSQWRYVDSLLDVGNTAAHPDDDWDKIGYERRRKMVRDVEEFTKEFL
ncbi:MAG: hypothetical protein ACTSRS_22950 [Candidatus Helarchaeota archaeon]